VARDKPLVANQNKLVQLYKDRLEDKEFDPKCEYKLISLQLDLAVYFQKGKLFAEILDDFYVDFERTFFCRVELNDSNIYLPKRIFFTHNGLQYSIYVSSDEQFKVF